MPQLDQFMHVYASQLFWLGIVLAILYFGVGHFMLPKIEGTMDARTAQIAGDVAAAQTARSDAEKIEEAWRAKMAESHASAQGVIAQAKDAAAQSTSQSLATTDAKLTMQTDKAHADIAQASQNAMSHVASVAAESAQSIVEKIAGLKIDLAAAQKAVNEVANHA